MAKRKKRLVKTVWATLIGLIITALLFNYAHDIHMGARVHYDAFGITVPRRYEIHGIDVSRYQQKINWKYVRDMEVRGVRLGFAFIKATEGLHITDPYFTRNWKHCADYKIIRGAYHYFHPDKDALAQAKYFTKRVRLKSGDLPPVIDIEETRGVSKSKLISNLKIWLDEVENIYGVKPVIYTSAHFYKTWLEGHFDAYPLWIAHYKTHTPRINREWHFWQHSETGNVNGIHGKVDFNVFNGDSLMFNGLLIP
jgi:lysozyme